MKHFKLIAKILLAFSLLICIISASCSIFTCGMLYLFAILDEAGSHYTYSEETIDKLQGNLPIYFRKIREQLEINNLPQDLTRIKEESYDNIVCYIEFKDSRIYTSIYCYPDGRETAHIWYTKKYDNLTQLTDLKQPSADEYKIMCSFAQGLTGKNNSAVQIETPTRLIEQIFNKDELCKYQEQFDNGEDVRIEQHEYFEDDRISWYIYLQSSYPEKITVRIECDIHFGENTLEQE